ncbi:LOW QUALITY PROTEIN: Hypothetical protein PHPALM_13912 [Phytophthora palmivora]|uniref:PiggyBac transposable element-derived protein domain-containing protein n=1 Tax=Phytophthora palmivora TaxID=4796 RepID=A0A2P4XW54_9STRA|nr:LOW QUALITY PROTEIN: Hypothetical protein PHPALM_13912 [Phytophthora palmivora]
MRGLEWDIYDQGHCADLKLDGAPLYGGRWGPTISAAAFAESLIGIFFYFLTKTLWLKVAAESEAYRKERIPAIAQKTRQLQHAAQAKDPKKIVDDLENIIDRLERQKSIKEYDILHIVGLLVDRTLCGHTDGLEKHWTVGEYGGVSRGTFGSPIVSFDEGTILNRSQYNPIRVYNKDKPHKYNTKCYMRCCADTGYCVKLAVDSVFDRIRMLCSVYFCINAATVYLGAESAKKKKPAHNKRLSSATIQNSMAKQRLTVADNFYSSAASAPSKLID